MKIGLIGLDTSHSEIFTRLLNDSGDPHHVTGGTITHAIPVFSEDLPISKDRFQTYKDIVEHKYNVEMVEDVDQFMKNVDAVLLATVDGRNHLDWLKKIVQYQKPIFIDKPIVLNSNDMEKVMELSKEYGTPIMSSSSLRFAESIRKFEMNDVVSAYIYGPLPFQQAMPGYFWYGIHMIEMVVKLFGTDISSIQKEQYEGYEILKLSFSNGNQVMIRGDYEWHDRFGGVLHFHNRVETFQLWKDERPYYANLLEEIVRFFESGVSSVSLDETAKIVQIIERINELE